MKHLVRAGLFGLLAAATPGEPAPSLDATTLGGEHLVLDALRGHVVVVDFWASWCEPCRRAFPRLESVAQRYASRGVRVVGVSVDEDRANCARFVRELHPSFAVVHDAGHALAERWSPPSMPTTFVVDARGVVTAVLSGEDVSQIERRVQEALAR